MAATRVPFGALEPGTRVEGFELERVLGAGGFGITYRARHAATGAAVALKELFLKGRCDRTDDGHVVVDEDSTEIFDWGLARFRQEIERLRELRHANVVRVHGGFESRSTLYMVMDYVEGVNLGRVLEAVRGDRRSVTESALVNLALPLLDALECIHERCIVHRDIKPDNVYLRGGGAPLLLDFGSAREIVPDASYDVTQLVTPGYAPPEQYEAKASGQGPWTDVYSLGVCLWALVTKRRPTTANARARQVQDGGEDEMQDRLEAYRGQYSDAFIDAVRDGITVHGPQRPQSVAAWRATFPAPADPGDRLGAPGDGGGLEVWREEAPESTVLATLRDLPTLRERLAEPRAFRAPLRDGGEGPEMVIVPTGFFHMGSAPEEPGARPSEAPRHWVSIEQPIAVGRHPVTFDDYDRFATATGRSLPSDAGWGRGDRPVVNVSWHDAVAYAEWLSEQTDRRYRLLSEAEWEYAARAGTETPYWWGEDVGRGHANCDGCGSRWDGERTSPVGSFAPNPFGLHDTAGNVWEWVLDAWHDDHRGAPLDGSARTGEGAKRVARGGSRFAPPADLRSAARRAYAPGVRSKNVGFRVARER